MSVSSEMHPVHITVEGAMQTTDVSQSNANYAGLTKADYVSALVSSVCTMH